MKLFFHPTVLAFLHKIGEHSASDIYRLIEVLKRYGHTLSMPFSKPIGHGLHELRIQGRPAFRVLYGFCNDEIVLLLAFKKQKPKLSSRDVEQSLERLRAYCGV